MNRIPTERYAWHTRVPLRVCAMLLAGSPARRLFVAGVPDEVAPDDPLAFIEGRRGAKLLVLDADSGEQTGGTGSNRARFSTRASPSPRDRTRTPGR